MARRNDSATVHSDDHLSSQKSWSNLLSDLPTHEFNEKPPLTRRRTTESCKSINVRKLPQYDSSFWLEYSTGQTITAEGPKTSFICKMVPKSGPDSDQFTFSETEKCCRRIAEDLIFHRNESDHHICRCHFEYIRTSAQGRSGTCDTVSKRFSKLVWNGMQRHDQLCQCGCFDFTSSGMSKIIPNWMYHPGYGCTSYWSRRIEHPQGFFWLQYGVSSGPGTDGPDCSFTCKVISRAEETPAGLVKIQKCCEQIAIELKIHRADERYSGRWEACPACACNFGTVRQGPRGQVGICCDNWSNKASAEIVWRAMKRHDRLCSCGCFDSAVRQSSVSGTTRYTDWKRHRKSKPYWSREVILMNGQTWHQYGVNSNSEADGEPDCIITCKKGIYHCKWSEKC